MTGKKCIDFLLGRAKSATRFFDIGSDADV